MKSSEVDLQNIVEGDQAFNHGPGGYLWDGGNSFRNFVNSDYYVRSVTLRRDTARSPSCKCNTEHKAWYCSELKCLEPTRSKLSFKW